MQCGIFRWVTAICLHVPAACQLLLCSQSQGPALPLSSCCLTVAAAAVAALLLLVQGGEVVPGSGYATTPLPMLMDDVVCSGREAQLGECEYLTVNNCTPEEELGIVCLGG